jgi:heptaprenyl diphosphate synthase
MTDRILPPGNTGRGNTVALLGALCFFLSALEYVVPRPLPFMRIGFANLPLLLALNILGAKDFFLLALLKSIGQGIIGGTFLSFLFPFSLAGTFASATVMFALGKLSKLSSKGQGRERFGFAGIGCAGAMVSNAVQILLASHPAFFGEAVRLLAPPFLASGFVSGIVLGIVCQTFCRRSRWYASCLHPCSTQQAENSGPTFQDGTSSKEPSGTGRRKKSRFAGLFRADELFVCGVLLAAVFLYDGSMPGHALQFLFFCLLAFLLGKKNNYIATATLMASVVFFGLLVPHGKVLYSLGPLSITEGSLSSSFERAVTLSGLMVLSRAFIEGDLRLPGSFGRLLSRTLMLLELMREKNPLRRSVQAKTAGQGKRAAPVKSAKDKAGIMARIDAMMLELENTAAENPGGLSRQKTGRSAAGILILATIIAAAFLLGLIRF